MKLWDASTAIIMNFEIQTNRLVCVSQLQEHFSKMRTTRVGVSSSDKTGFHLKRGSDVLKSFAVCMTTTRADSGTR
jgi:hypothetical protein